MFGFGLREHGDGPLRAQASSGALVDFSVNLNPYGPNENVVAAARAADLTAYPESTALPAREAWAARLGCQPQELVFGHGAAELIWLVARVLLGPDDTCAIFSPTFSEAEAAARAAGAQVRALRASAERGFVHDLDAVADVVGRCTLAYLCTPNNPTGGYVSPLEILELARRCERTTFLVDQSFLSLSRHAEDLEHPSPDNVVCVRSLTKDHALAGLRVGFLRCRPELAAALEAQRAAWPTSAPAQAAAIQAASEDEFVRASWVCMSNDRTKLTSRLRELGLRPLPTVTSYQLVPVPNARSLAARLRDNHGVVVRDCTSFGLPGHIRLAARPEADRQRLLDALARELR